VVKAAIGGGLGDSMVNDVDDSRPINHLFDEQPGDSTLHKAARDLRYLIHRPFGTSLELGLDNPLINPSVQSTMVNWMEAAMGTTWESTWELDNCAPSQSDQQNLDLVLDPALTMNQEDVAEGESEHLWSTWTPQAF